ncbi:hypothetical protein X801_05674 [Opisthorchis viverrini]|uniref:Uncharacterized protein n=1 Tax=Opisthorchis viverrini TaxID=6198 RepID=A0A1S8WVK0_OPIVI|nr:hypothetical protein X801_05674 [Opisthorchis viverrini]
MNEQIHQVKHQYRFQSRTKLPSKRLSIFVRGLRRMTENVLSGLHDEPRKKISLSKPSSASAPLNSHTRWKSSWQLWEPNTVHFASVHIQQQHDRQMKPNRGQPYLPVRLRPNQSCFHFLLQRPAPTRPLKWPTRAMSIHTSSTSENAPRRADTADHCTRPFWELANAASTFNYNETVGEGRTGEYFKHAEALTRNDSDVGRTKHVRRPIDT